MIASMSVDLTPFRAKTLSEAVRMALKEKGIKALANVNTRAHIEADTDSAGATAYITFQVTTKDDIFYVPMTLPVTSSKRIASSIYKGKLTNMNANSLLVASAIKNIDIITETIAEAIKIKNQQHDDF